MPSRIARTVYSNCMPIRSPPALGRRPSATGMPPCRVFVWATVWTGSTVLVFLVVCHGLLRCCLRRNAVFKLHARTLAVRGSVWPCVPRGCRVPCIPLGRLFRSPTVVVGDSGGPTDDAVPYRPNGVFKLHANALAVSSGTWANGHWYAAMPCIRLGHRLDRISRCGFPCGCATGCCGAVCTRTVYSNCTRVCRLCVAVPGRACRGAAMCRVFCWAVRSGRRLSFGRYG